MKNNNIAVLKNAVGQSAASPRVLVLMATYNAGNWLHAQVESILAQEEVDVTIVIGDDLSRDATRTDIVKYWGHLPNVSLAGWESPSGSAGANFRRLYRAAETTGFDFVALADQDDIWLPRKMISAVQSMSAAGAQGYSCSVEAFWPDHSTKEISQSARIRQGDYLFEGAGQGCTFVVTAALFGRVRDFCIAQSDAAEALHYHDWLIYLLTRTWNMTWYFDSRPFMRYRQHENNEIGSRGSVASVIKRLKMIQNGWYRRQVLAAIDISRLAGGPSNDVTFTTAFHNAGTSFRQVRIACYVLLHSRRRLTDRLILAFSAVMSWI